MPVRLRRTVTIGLVVGTLLSLVNQGGALVSGDASVGTLLKVATNYLTPFVVSNLGLLSGRSGERQDGSMGREVKARS